MDIHTIRQQLRRMSIYDIPLRVTFYARVSSESDEQLNSLGNQITYYEDLISRNVHWTYVKGYIDEGLSAATTKNRENFHRMIEDGEAGLFDLVITKEITRFARNTLDSIQYTRRLLSAGVGVFFQNDNINTLDEDSELRLTIMSGIAQDELRKLSSRVKFGHQQAIKKSVVLGNSRIFGYRKDGGRLVIDEEEAPMVRELFERYATGEYSMKQLETLFWEKGYRNHNGKKIAHTTMSGVIANPKYKGYYVGNKVKVIDLFTKKQKFLPPEEWVMFKDETGEIVPAIVDEGLWDQANAVLKKRSEDVKNRQGICNHANLLTGKLYCTHCGAAYYRRDSVDRSGRKNSKWVCSGKIKNGADSCPSSHVLISKYLIPAAISDHLASAEHDDPLRPLADQLHIVGRDQNRLRNMLHLIQRTHNLSAGRDIQIGSRLIQKQDLRIQSHADGQAGPPHLPAGEKAPIPVFQLCQPEPLQKLRRPLPPVRHLPFLHGKGDICFHRILDEHILRILVYQRNDLGKSLRSGIPDLPSLQEHPALLGL